MNFDSKGFIFRSGPAKKEKQNSNFWMNDNDTNVDEFLGLDTDKPKGRDLVALAGYKRAISNFVSIVTGENIPVVFNSKDESFTDGKKVTIGASIDDKKFDVAVGLALHEGSHIKLSDFNVLRNLETSIPAQTFVLAEKAGVDRRTVISTVKNILNYIEDRRIDSFIFRTSPGYKGYYHAMYDKYFYSKNIDKGLLSAEFRTETIESYMFRIVNLHNKNKQLGALKGLKDIYELINLAGIQRGSVVTDTSMAVTMACEVMDIILMEIDPLISEEPTSDEEGNSPSNGDGSSDNTMSDEEFDSLLDSIENGDMNGSSDSSGGNGKSIQLPVEPTTPDENLGNDDGSDCVELSDRQKELLKKAFEKQEKFLDGDIQKTQLSKKDSNDIKAIDESGASYENVGDGIKTGRWQDYGKGGSGTKCLVIKKLTQGLIDSDMFSCASSWNQSSYNSTSEYSRRNYNFIQEGFRLGTMLGRKLQVRSEEKVTKFTRQDAGRLDKRLIAELGFGNGNVFSQTLTDRYNKAYLHISVDASGSMCGSKWNKAMTSAVAMIKAADMAGNIEVVLSIRTTHSKDHSQGVPMIMVCYDSRTDKLSKVRNLFSALDVSGTTPEGLCFEAIAKDLIPGNGTQDSYFINFSDGQPWYSNNEINYSGYEAEKHTQKMVKNMKNQGIKVLSYFISDYSYDRDDYDNKAFRTMYGADASFINATNMMQVARTMNKKFLQK